MPDGGAGRARRGLADGTIIACPTGGDLRICHVNNPAPDPLSYARDDPISTAGIPFRIQPIRRIVVEAYFRPVEPRFPFQWGLTVQPSGQPIRRSHSTGVILRAQDEVSPCGVLGPDTPS